MNKNTQKLNQLVEQDINQNNNEIAKLMEKMANGRLFDSPICSRQSPYSQNNPQHIQTDQHRGIKASNILWQNELGSSLVGRSQPNEPALQEFLAGQSKELRQYLENQRVSNSKFTAPFKQHN